jgi:NAD(P)-dependent dehydrogenase (short-subunit alcohol dehydrogenase family)
MRSAGAEAIWWKGDRLRVGNAFRSEVLVTARTGSTPLVGQTALVTGGGRGLGRAMALALAGRGASVAVVARSEGELEETVRLVSASGGTAHGWTADVTDADAIRQAIDAIERKYGGIDLLVNNAGVLGPIGPTWETTVDEWWRAMDVNVRGPLLCTNAVLPGMIARSRGRIINIASGSSTNAFAYISAYVVSKTALVRLTECLGAELRPLGISVFAVEPGSVETTMTDISRYSPAGQRWIPWFSRIFDYGLNSPPERVAGRVCLLATGIADVLSGRYIPIAEDVETMVAQFDDIENRRLYSLRLGRLTESMPPVLAAIRAEGERGRMPPGDPS